MAIINIQAAKTHLSRLVEQAAKGEEIILAKAGKPIAKLVPYAQPRKARTGGQFSGKIWESPDCWAKGASELDAALESPLYQSVPNDQPEPMVAESFEHTAPTKKL
jgi:prevent-host-death family protein